MANPGEALAASIDAQWSGLGGVKPTDIEYIVNTSDFEPNPTAIDAIFVFLPMRGTKERWNSKLRNATYFPRVVCQTKTNTARLEQITNEVDRIVAAGTPITGATYQDVLEVNDISDRMRGGYPFWVSEIQCKIFTQFEVSATAYGTATAALLTTDTLTVNTAILGSPASTLGATTVEGYDLSQANMLGVANRAYVPCIYETGTTSDRVISTGQNLANLGALDNWWLFELPLPTAKGSLKLYVDGIQVGLFAADADDYISGIFVVGQVYDAGSDIFYTDNVDKTSRELIQANITLKDCSIFETVRVTFNNFLTDANDLIISSVSLRCFYDT